MTRWIHISDLQLGLGKADNDESDELAADLVQAEIGRASCRERVYLEV